MPVEFGTYINSLNALYPEGTDLASTVDNHLRLLKSTIKATFPNVTGAVTPTHTELNYVAGVTSAIQTQLNAKAAKGANADITSLSACTTITGMTTPLSIAQGGTGSANGAIPSGAVMHFAMATAPSGWLKADGSEVSRATYAALDTAIGTTFGAYTNGSGGAGTTHFVLPDLRGEFIRGYHDGDSADPDYATRAFGSAQADALKAHTHTVPGTPLQINGPHPDLLYSVNWGGSGVTGSTGAAETRPRNIALLACIKT